MSDGRTERAKAQREERRAQILIAALQVFADKGYHQTSVSDLVGAAGVARGTFYLYFEGKQQIFLELLDNLLGAFRGSVRGVDTSPDAPPFAEQLEGTVLRILDAAAFSKALATIIFREAVGLDDEVDARLRGFEQQLHTWLVDSLDNGMRLGLLRQHDSDLVATVIYGSMRQLIHRHVVAGDTSFDREDAAREAVAVFLGGLTA